MAPAWLPGPLWFTSHNQKKRLVGAGTMLKPVRHTYGTKVKDAFSLWVLQSNPRAATNQLCHLGPSPPLSGLPCLHLILKRLIQQPDVPSASQGNGTKMRGQFSPLAPPPRLVVYVLLAEPGLRGILSWG